MPISIAGSGAVTGASTLNGLTVPTDAIAPGIVLIASQSFSSASSISVNNCFSSTYDRYLLALSVTGTSATGYQYLRLRSSGVDSTTTYYGAMSGWRSSASTYTDASNNVSQFTLGTAANNHSHWIINIFNPALSNALTNFSGTMSAIDGTSTYMCSIGGNHQTFAAYDGITVYPSSGTLSGSLKIYGYRNA